MISYSIEEILEKAENAYDKGELVKFISGEGEYFIQIDQSVPAMIPIDFERIIVYGVYGLCRGKDNVGVKNVFVDSLLQLISGNAFQVWIAYNIFFYQIGKESRKRSPFIIVDDNLIASLKKAINYYQKELANFNEWNGKILNNNLWADIVSSNKIIVKYYGVSLV